MRALAALLFLASLQCAAAPFAVPVGEARIGLDAPPGFADTSFTGSPRLRELAESQTSPSNRLLLFAISDGDLRRFMSGDTPEFRRYMIVVTPKALEHRHIDRQEFRRLLGDAARAPEGAERLGQLRDEDDVFSVVQQTRLPDPPRSAFSEAKPPQYVLSTLTVIRLRGKAINLAVYSRYDGPEDLAWIRGTTLRWIESLERLNSL